LRRRKVVTLIDPVKGEQDSAELEQAVRTRNKGERGQGGRRKGKTLAETDWQAAALSSESVRICDQLRRP
jgi:hypothetical protein